MYFFYYYYIISVIIIPITTSNNLIHCFVNKDKTTTLIRRSVQEAQQSFIN